MSSNRDAKRKNGAEDDISPPPLRRKVQSSTTKDAVSSFFTPTSKKAPEPITWQERAPSDRVQPSLIVGKYVSPNVPPQPKDAPPAAPKRKIAAFDFDWTLVKTASGKRFVFDAGDWKWFHPSVPGVLRKLYNDENYLVVMVSNQGAIPLKPNPKAPTTHRTRLEEWKRKINFVLRDLDIPTSIYAATAFDNFRKPRTGMWDEILKDYNLAPEDVDMEGSFFVGDAAGRIAVPGIAKDFSDSDRALAENLGIKFHTPEEYFLKEKPREYVSAIEPENYLDAAIIQSADSLPAYIKSGDQEIVLFVGSPGSGKSTFYERFLRPLGHKRVNQDLLKTRDKCIKAAREHIKEGHSVAIDATNPDEATRAHWTSLASETKVPIRCVLFLANTALCKHNDAVRAFNASMNPENRTILPAIAFNTYNSRFRAPTVEEGFRDITEVPFQFQGSEAEKAVWTRRWT